MQRTTRGGVDPQKLRETTNSVMVLIGEDDDLVGSGDGVAAFIPGAVLVKVPGDHITAVGQPAFRQAIVDFLGRA